MVAWFYNFLSWFLKPLNYEEKSSQLIKTRCVKGSGILEIKQIK